MRRPWAKYPTALPLDPRLRRLRLALRWTYSCCYVWACDAVPLGYVVREDGLALSQRELGSYIGLHHKTVGRHVEELLRQGLLAIDLAARLSVTAIVQSFPTAVPSTSSADGETTVPERTGTQLSFPQPPPVAVPGEAPSGALFTDSRGNDPPTPSMVLEVEKDVRQAVVDDDVDNYPPLETFGPRRDLIPKACDPDSEIAHLLAQLASMHESWERALSNRRDAGNIGRLAVAHPQELYDALAQESLEPTAKNPAAWLNATVVRRAESREATA
jgi:hypothetical protein